MPGVRGNESGIVHERRGPRRLRCEHAKATHGVNVATGVSDPFMQPDMRLSTLVGQVAVVLLCLFLATNYVYAAGKVVPDLVIVFPPNTDIVSSDDLPTLEGFAAELKSHNVQWISLEGFAADQGSRELNLALAQRRVNDVSRHLIMLGVPANRIHGMGYGEGSMEESGLPTHRVEIRVFKLPA